MARYGVVGDVLSTCGPLAQLAEQQTLNLRVPSSTLGRLTSSDLSILIRKRPASRSTFGN
jgi:hypothetical protein